MEYILLIETGGDVCSVALSNGDKLLSHRESHEGRAHAQNVAVYAEELLAEHGIGCENLSAVALGIGPGSYTGLRIGSSFAKGICYSANIPLIGVSSLESMVYGLKTQYLNGDIQLSNFDNKILAPMIDARRMEVYTQLYNSDIQPLSEIAAEVITEDSFAQYKERDFVIFGSGAEKCKEVLKVGDVLYINATPSARNMIDIAYKKFKDGKFEDIAYFEPYYLKDFVSTTKKRNLLDVVKKNK